MITVNITKAISATNSLVSQLAYNEAQHRTSKAGAGLTNVLSDTDWAALLTNVRTSVSSATTTAELKSAINNLQTAITANAL